MVQSVTLVSNHSFILKHEDFLYTMTASVGLLQIWRSNHGVTKQITTCSPVLCF